jgi:hypothetical protein
MSAQDLTLQTLVESIPLDYSIMITRDWTGTEWMVTVWHNEERCDKTILPWHEHLTTDPECTEGDPSLSISDQVIHSLRKALAHAESGGRGYK